MYNNISFGMSYISPSKNDMPYFKRFLAKKTGKIDTKALGEFIIKQAENENVLVKYARTAEGDRFEIISPKETRIVHIKDSKPSESKNKTLLCRFKEWFKNKTEKIEYNPQGLWENLPEEMLESGRIADEMEKSLK